MKPAEIAFRLRRKASTGIERWQHALGRYDWHENEWERRLGGRRSEEQRQMPLGDWWLDHMQNRSEDGLLLDQVQMDRSARLFDQLFPGRRARIVDRASQLLELKFNALGQTYELERPIPWQHDPVAGIPFPKTFFGDKSLADSTIQVDAKHVWELNRHEFLIDSGKAFRLSQDSRYAEHAVEVMNSWTEQNRYLEGINWLSPLEVSIRAMSWLWTCQFCRSWSGWQPESHLRIIKSLYQHGHYLYRHLSFYISPYNHLIGEATGLFLLGCCFPEFDESAKWRARAWRVLTDYAADQFHEDGGSVEQATSYHHYCLGFLLLALLTRQQRGEPVPQALAGRVERALEFSMWMTQPDGLVPRIGDMDDARSIRFESRDNWDFRNLLSLGAAIFARSDLHAVSGGISEDVLWLMGSDGVEALDRLPAVPPKETSKLFCASGYSITRSGWGERDHFCCFDCGPIAAGIRDDEVPSAAHGHADLLSFDLSIRGEPVIVDSGFYQYCGNEPWHRYFREVSAHNTVRVDGSSTAQFTGMMAWSNARPPEWLKSSSASNFELIEGGHTSFVRAPGVRHRRAILWNRDDTWFVFDRLEGDGIHDVDLFFHLAPGSTVRMIDDVLTVRTASGQHVALGLVESGLLETEIIENGDEPDRGWVATSYGVRQRAPVIRFHGRRQLPLSVSVAVVSLGTSDIPPKLTSLDIRDCRNTVIHDAHGCRVMHDKGTCTAGFVWETAGRKLIAGQAFENRLLLHDDRTAAPETSASMAVDDNLSSRAATIPSEKIPSEQRPDTDQQLTSSTDEYR